MKLFAFIFSFYLLALSCVPCTDDSDCKNEKQITNSNFITTQQNNHHNETENCTPFCICTCCGQNLNNSFVSYKVNFTLPVIAQNFPFYTTSFISKVFFSIWQPPKIS